MAKVNETVFQIKVSELLRDETEAQPVFSDETIGQIQQVLEELAVAICTITFKRTA